MKRSIGPRTRAFVAELRDFCRAEPGRAIRLAEYLGLPRNRVYQWWNGETSFPTTEQLLSAMEWLEKMKSTEAYSQREPK